MLEQEIQCYLFCGQVELLIVFTDIKT